MRLPTALLAVWLAGMVVACGGGSTSPITSQIPPIPPTAPNTPLVGYWGTKDNQIAETADHVSIVLITPWGWQDVPGERERQIQLTIAQLQEAQARGIRKAIVSIDFLIFTQSDAYRGTSDLQAFKTRVESLGLTNIVALYVIDEPELHHLSDARMTQINAEIKAVWSLPLATVFGDGATKPGLASFDWVGYDNYGIGEAAIGKAPALSPNQRRILVPGGADPWRADPAGWMAQARADPQVVAVLAFVWFDWDHAGIRSNGMAPAYRAAYR